MTTFRRSQIGLGTYRGPSNDEADALLAGTILSALSLGVRCFDTAINYRCQRSEQVLGAVLGDAFSRGLVGRADCHVSSKAGFVPWDLEPPMEEPAYDRQIVVDAGLATSAELSLDGHCLAPAFISWSFNKTLRNLGLNYLDCLYIHNPEAQLSICTHEVLYERLRTAFAVLESFVESGRLRAYGVSSWAGLRVPQEHPEHLSLQRIVDAASEARADHRLHFVQAPLSLLMPEVATSRFQADGASLLSEVKRLNLKFVASAPLGGGALRSRARAALDFVRSLPHVEYVLVGAKDPASVELPAALLKEPSLSGSQLLSLLEQLGREDAI